jgi:flagellar hook-associated protein 2
MATSGVSSLFSGNSRFATDFQQIIERSVGIASLPLQQIQNQKSQLGQERAAVASLQTKFTALQTALSQIQSSLANLTVSASSPGVASATVGAGAMTGTYQLEVISTGSYTMSLSADGLATVTDPATQNISSASSFTLWVGGEEYEIHPAANTLNALAEALNASGAGVEATVVNVGSSGAPDYRLSVRATKLGDLAIQLNDGERDLLNTLANGTPASYRVQGSQGDPIISDSRTITLAPGLTVNLLAPGSTQLTLQRNLTGLSAAMSALAGAYNGALQELDLHRGQATGALRGSSLVQVLSSVLRDLGRYRPESGWGSLEDLGLSFDQNGLLSVDDAALQARAQTDWAGLAAFLGDGSASGFLKSAGDALAGALNSDSGVFPSTLQGLSAEQTRLEERIAAEQERIDQLRQNLEARMAAADALIASMEQQAKYFQGLFESMMSSWQNRR